MILDLYVRPIELFNPANRQHRAHYARFLREDSWGSCPVRFMVDGEQSNNNLAFAMQRMLTEYYIQREFKDADLSVRQKAKKTVDTQAV